MTVDDWRKLARERVEGRYRIWRASGGREIRVCDLTSEHLINALNWIEKVRSGSDRIPNNDQRTEDYFWLRTEAMRRGLRWRVYSQVALHDGDLRLDNELGGDLALSLTGRCPEDCTPPLHDFPKEPAWKRFTKSSRPSQFPTYEDIARGYGGKHPTARDEKEMPLRDLAPGGKFKLLPTSPLVMKGSSPSYIYMKTVPIGMTAQALRDRGCRMEHLWTRDGNLSSADSTVRCLVANLVKGNTFLIPADEVVMHYEGHRIG